MRRLSINSRLCRKVPRRYRHRHSHSHRECTAIRRISSKDRRVLSFRAALLVVGILTRRAFTGDFFPLLGMSGILRTIVFTVLERNIQELGKVIALLELLVLSPCSKDPMQLLFFKHDGAGGSNIYTPYFS